MALTYSLTAINARLNGTVSAIGAGGFLKLFAGGLDHIPLATPAGTVSAGTLAFTTPENATATNSGLADSATVTTSTGALMISNLTVGIPLSGANVIITNGINSTFLTATTTVTLVSAQIIGA